MTDAASRRQAKRMAAAHRKHGACCICRFRENVDGVPMCKGYTNRGQGMCKDDGLLPKFRTDDDAVRGFSDDAR